MAYLIRILLQSGSATTSVGVRRMNSNGDVILVN